MKYFSKRAGRVAWACFLCLVMLCCALPRVQAAPQTIPESLVTYNPFTGYNFSHNAAFSGHSLVHMIDVSEFNTVTNWNAVKASGVDAVILRAGFRWSGSGRLQKDDKFDAYIQGALAAGLNVGVYFYSEATNVQEAAEEARTVLAYLAPYKSSITLPVAFDFEFTNHGRLYNTCQTIANTQGMAAARAHGTALCRAFASEITAAGMRPMVYADRNRLQNWLNASEVAEVADIWVASWVDADDAYTTYSASRYCAWQYCSNLRINGIAGNVDGDFLYVANGTSGGDTDPTPSPTPTPEPSPEIPPTTPTPSPSQQAVVNLSASATSITLGQSVTLTVSVDAQNIGSMVCSFSNNLGSVSTSVDPPGRNSLTASKSFTPSEVGTYTITATCDQALSYISNGDGSYSYGSVSGGSSSVTITVVDNTPTPSPIPTPGEDGNVYLLSGLRVGTTYAEIRAALAEDEDMRDLILHVFDAAYNPKEDNAIICTGDILTFATADNPETLIEIDIIVIFGDVSGDGKIDLIDIMDMRQILCETKEPSLVASYAADVNGDEKIDLIDLMDLRQHICGTKLIDQVKTTEDASE